MERNISKYLTELKNSPYRKPLILQGVRGKWARHTPSLRSDGSSTRMSPISTLKPILPLKIL